LGDRLQTAAFSERAKERLGAAMQEYLLAMLELTQELMKQKI
jgi:hypothetical protein